MTNKITVMNTAIWIKKVKSTIKTATDARKFAKNVIKVTIWIKIKITSVRKCQTIVILSILMAIVNLVLMAIILIRIFISAKSYQITVLKWMIIIYVLNVKRDTILTNIENVNLKMIIVNTTILMDHVKSVIKVTILTNKGNVNNFHLIVSKLINTINVQNVIQVTH